MKDFVSVIEIVINYTLFPRKCLISAAVLSIKCITFYPNRSFSAINCIKQCKNTTKIGILLNDSKPS